ALARALADGPDRLRHRVRIPGPPGGGDRRVPALPLPGRSLTAWMAAVTSILQARFGEQLLDRVGELIGDGNAARLDEDLAAMPDLLAATLYDQRARESVAARDLRVRAIERHGRPLLEWHAPDPDAPRLLDALVDAHARAAFAAHLTDTAGSGTPVEDPYEVLSALAADTELCADLPTRRRITAAFAAFADSGRPGVRLSSTDSELVVRLFEPPLGTAWPLQTCLREADGTVHPVADLRAVGDLTTAGAAEASAAVMRLAGTVRDAAVDDTGVDWLLT